MFADVPQPLATLHDVTERLLRRQQEALVEITQAVSALKDYRLRDQPDQQWILSRLILAADPPPVPGKNRRLCFQPLLSCHGGLRIRMWEPTGLQAASNGTLDWLGYVEDRLAIVQLEEVRPEIRLMLLPNFLLMLKELLAQQPLVKV